MWFDAGRVCLDLVATSAPHEGIRDTDELRLWLTGAGLVPDRTPLARLGPDWVEAFRALRDDVETLVRAEIAGRDADEETLARVNAPAAAPPRGCAPYGTNRDTSYGNCAAEWNAPGCSRPSPGTPSNCSPIPATGRCCGPARATAAPASTWTPRAGTGAAGAPASCAETASGWPATGAGCWRRGGRRGRRGGCRGGPSGDPA